jgi:DNA-binding Xre family transcriptional regulator
VNLRKAVAKNINKYRKISIAKLAEKAGISKFTIQAILYGSSKSVDGITLVKIAKALNVSIDNLVK